MPEHKDHYYESTQKQTGIGFEKEENRIKISATAVEYREPNNNDVLKYLYYFAGKS